MPLFGRRSGPGDDAMRAAQAQQEASLGALAAGGLPLRATERLGAAGCVLTNLSVQDYWLLRRGGYRPAGLIGASGVFYVVSGWQQQQAQRGWGAWANQELSDFTQGVYDAREVTIGRLTRQAREQ